MSVGLTPESVVDAGLVYVTDQAPGISRKRSGTGFSYYDPAGNLVKNRATLRRIRALAIPPAYTDVWICPLDNGHIQATCRDARGRKQYRYHPLWIEASQGNKFDRMVEFGRALPAIRERVEADLRKPGLSRDKVLATVVWFLEKSLIRVGNEEYAKENQSYGLTTLRMRHVKVDGSIIQFKFKGKRGILHDVQLADKRLARIVKKIQELPGQELFQWVDEDGQRHAVSSQDVNDYLREITGQEFTAKDFRTWGATVLALAELSLCGDYSSQREAKSMVVQAMRAVAQHLRNTAAICRKSYIHPAIVESFMNGSLQKYLKERVECGPDGFAPERSAEVAVLELLEQARPELAA